MGLSIVDLRPVLKVARIVADRPINRVSDASALELPRQVRLR
jgi:hypothetical protein